MTLKLAAAAEKADGVARGGRRLVIEDDEESDTEEAEEIRERGTKTSGEVEDDYQEDDTSPNKSGGDGARNVRVRLFRGLPEDELEESCDEDGKGEGDPSVTAKQKKNKRKRGQAETGGGEKSPKKKTAGGRRTTTKRK